MTTTTIVVAIFVVLAQVVGAILKQRAEKAEKAKRTAQRQPTPRPPGDARAQHRDDGTGTAPPRQRERNALGSTLPPRRTLEEQVLRDPAQVTVAPKGRADGGRGAPQSGVPEFIRAELERRGIVIEPAPRGGAPPAPPGRRSVPGAGRRPPQKGERGSRATDAPRRPGSGAPPAARPDAGMAAQPTVTSPPAGVAVPPDALSSAAFWQSSEGRRPDWLRAAEAFATQPRRDETLPASALGRLLRRQEAVRQAIVMAEILGPPVSERAPD